MHAHMKPILWDKQIFPQLRSAYCQISCSCDVHGGSKTTAAEEPDPVYCRRYLFNAGGKALEGAQHYMEQGGGLRV